MIHFPSKGGGGSQNLGTVPKLYIGMNYEGFPNKLCRNIGMFKAHLGFNK